MKWCRLQISQRSYHIRSHPVDTFLAKTMTYCSQDASAIDHLHHRPRCWRLAVLQVSSSALSAAKEARDAAWTLVRAPIKPPQASGEPIRPSERLDRANAEVIKVSADQPCIRLSPPSVTIRLPLGSFEAHLGLVSLYGVPGPECRSDTPPCCH